LTGEQKIRLRGSGVICVTGSGGGKLEVRDAVRQSVSGLGEQELSAQQTVSDLTGGGGLG
jgi:hypothetical protein